MCSLPYLCISGVLPQRGGILQRLTWEDIPECPEIRWGIILPYRDNFSLWNINLHVMCNNYSQNHIMEHLWMPLLPAPIARAIILDVMVNWINAWIRTYIYLTVFIHLYAPILIEFILTHFSDNVSVVTLVEWIYLFWCCTNRSTGNKCAPAGKPSQWWPLIPLLHHFLLFVPPSQHFLLPQQAKIT